MITQSERDRMRAEFDAENKYGWDHLLKRRSQTDPRLPFGAALALAARIRAGEIGKRSRF
jgi:hypothetical protein